MKAQSVFGGVFFFFFGVIGFLGGSGEMFCVRGWSFFM